MTLTLDLPAGMETAIQQEAARQGTTPEALALDGLRRLYPEAQGSAPGIGGTTLRTGADLLAIMKRDGLFLDREGQPDSPELARQIRETAWRRGHDPERATEGRQEAA